MIMMIRMTKYISGYRGLQAKVTVVSRSATKCIITDERTVFKTGSNAVPKKYISRLLVKSRRAKVKVTRST